MYKLIARPYDVIDIKKYVISIIKKNNNILKCKRCFVTKLVFFCCCSYLLQKKKIHHTINLKYVQ